MSKLRLQLSLLALSLALTAGCQGKDPAAAGAGGGQGAPPPPTVEVTRVEVKSVDATRQMPAELKATETADIRSRVEGTLLNSSFQEGSQVVGGQVLFQLDPRPYQAEVDEAEAGVEKARAGVVEAEGRLGQARAGLAQRQASLERARNQVNRQEVTAEVAEAKANLDAAEREVKRFRPLVDQGAVPKQRYDQVVDQRDVAKSKYEAVRAKLRNTDVSDKADINEAEADVEAARADVTAAQADVGSARAALQAAQATLNSAQLNLNYTTITAPFSGVVGTLGVDPGSLVIPGQTRLATLSKNDSVYADFSISESAYLDLAQGQGFEQAPFKLILANDKEYPHPGEFVLVDRNVTEGTGSIMVRAKFPNPEHLLKPGGFGRVTMQTATLADAVVIPQKALTNIQSLDAVYVLKPDQTVEQRTITLGERLEGEVVVTKGLEGGEQVVVEGLQKIRPGAKVQVGEANKVSYRGETR